MSSFPLYDALLNGRLRKILAGYREQRLGVRRIASRLEADHGVAVSPSTVARWCSDQGLPFPGKGPA